MPARVCELPQAVALPRCIAAIAALQTAVRARSTAVRAARAAALDAFEAVNPQRNVLLWLLNAMVALYALACLYIICLFGTCLCVCVWGGGGGVLRAAPLRCGPSESKLRPLWFCVCACCDWWVCGANVPRCSSSAAVKFPRSMESAWLLASGMGFLLDVFVYHTFSLLLKSVLKLRTCTARAQHVAAPPPPPPPHTHTHTQTHTHTSSFTHTATPRRGAGSDGSLEGSGAVENDRGGGCSSAGQRYAG